MMKLCFYALGWPVIAAGWLSVAWQRRRALWISCWEPVVDACCVWGSVVLLGGFVGIVSWLMFGQGHRSLPVSVPSEEAGLSQVSVPISTLAPLSGGATLTTLSPMPYQVLSAEFSSHKTITVYSGNITFSFSAVGYEALGCRPGQFVSTLSRDGVVTCDFPGEDSANTGTSEFLSPANP